MSLRFLTLAAASALATTAALADVEYTGPTFDWSQVGPEFRIGFTPDEAMQGLIARNQCLKEYISVAFQVPSDLYTFTDYAGTMEALRGGNLDYAWVGASAYAGIEIEDPDAVVPVLTRVQPTGDEGYYSVMVARADSGIESLEDLEGRTLGFADPNSTSGYLVPQVELDEQLDGGVEGYFADTRFMGGHPNAVLGVLNGDVDAAVTWASGVGERDVGYTSGNLRIMVDNGTLNMDDIVEVWRSSLIPNGPIVMPEGLPDGAYDTMVGMMQWIHENDRECSTNIATGEVREWIRVDDAFYDTIVKARRAVVEN
jgi:phosphonate transport system substrate-binding protein